MPRAKAKPKENPINQLIIKEPEPVPEPTPPPTPPPSPPSLKREPRKRNPPNYKLKMGILHILQENIKLMMQL